MLVHRLLDGTKPMPQVGVKVRDYAAIAVICQWIDSLPAPPQSAEETEKSDAKQLLPLAGSPDDATEEVTYESSAEGAADVH